MRQLKLESEVSFPDWGPGNFPPARVWAFVPGWQQRPELQIYTHPQVIVVSLGQEGEEGAEAGYRPPLKAWLGAFHTQEGFSATKSACSPARALGTLCQDRMTHWLPSFASLWETLSQGPSPRRAWEQLLSGSRSMWDLQSELRWKHSIGKFSCVCEPSGLNSSVGSPRPCLPSSFKSSNSIPFNTGLSSLHEPTWLEISESSGQTWMQKFGPSCKRWFDKHHFKQFWSFQKSSVDRRNFFLRISQDQ